MLQASSSEIPVAVFVASEADQTYRSSNLDVFTPTSDYLRPLPSQSEGPAPATIARYLVDSASSHTYDSNTSRQGFRNRIPQSAEAAWTREESNKMTETRCDFASNGEQLALRQEKDIRRIHRGAWTAAQHAAVASI